jgi:hypothetical protein
VKHLDFTHTQKQNATGKFTTQRRNEEKFHKALAETRDTHKLQIRKIENGNCDAACVKPSNWLVLKENRAKMRKTRRKAKQR